MNVSGINTCTPLKPSFGKDEVMVDLQPKTTKELPDSYWDNSSGAEKVLDQVNVLVDMSPKENNTAFKNVLATLGIVVSSAITAGFLAKKATKIFPAIGENLLKLAKKVNPENANLNLEKLPKAIGSKITPDGKIVKTFNTAKEVAQKLYNSGKIYYKKFASIGAGSELKKAGGAALAANGLVNAAAGISGAASLKSILKDENNNGVADKFEKTRTDALHTIRLFNELETMIGDEV